MFSQDYFGFVGLQSKSHRSNHKKATQRTELSEEKVHSKEKVNKQQEQGIEKLKVKYEQIMKKNVKKKPNRKLINKKVQDHYYHGAKIKYYHYNDDGYYNENKKIKQRVQQKAIKAFQRIKTQSPEIEKKQSKSNSLKHFVSDKNKDTEILIPKLTVQEDEIWQLQKESNLKRSVYSDSNLLQQNSKNGRQLRKMKNQERIHFQKSNFDNYKLESYKQGELQSKSQILLINSIPRSQNSNLIPMISRVGLQSKVEVDENRRKYPHTSYQKNKKFDMISSDYEAIKKMQAQKSMVKLLIDSQSRLGERMVRQKEQVHEKQRQKDIKETNIFSAQDLEQQKKKWKLRSGQESVSSLSNMIRESGKIFTDKKQSKLINNVNEEYNFTGTGTFQIIQQKLVRENRTNLSLKPTNSLLNGQSQSRIIYNQSKVSSNFSNSKDYYDKKCDNPRLTVQPSQVRQIQSGQSEQFLESRIEKQASLLMKLESRQNIQNGQFYLLDSIRQCREYEERALYSKLVSKSQENFQCVELIQNIYKHLDIVNQIVDFVQMSTQLYEKHQNSHWMQLQSFLIYKKFHEERSKIVESLKEGKPSCFKCEKALVKSYSLLKYRKNSLIKEICDSIQNCNIFIWKSLNSYYWQIKQFHTANSILSLDPFKKKDLSEVVKRLYEQYEILDERAKEMEGEEGEENSEDEKDKEIIYLRCYKIMELVFLISCLEGRKVQTYKQGEDEDFEHYCEENFGKFKETVLYFNVTS